MALASLVRSFRQLGPGSAELVFLNDGPIPAARLRLMEASGEVLARSKLGLRGSMQCALELPTLRHWSRDDLVWFSEDDYLYLPRALPDVVAAAAVFPEAAYFGLYALIGSRLPSGGLFDDLPRVPRGWRESAHTPVNGHSWCRALSTASTFGARIAPLVEDRAMMKLAMRTGGAWDHTTSLMYQGFLPYPIATMRQSFREAADSRSLMHRAAVLATRLALNGYHAARRVRQADNRLLVAPDPPLATHVEANCLAEGTDWQAAAADTQHWLRATQPD